MLALYNQNIPFNYKVLEDFRIRKPNFSPNKVIPNLAIPYNDEICNSHFWEPFSQNDEKSFLFLLRKALFKKL